MKQISIILTDATYAYIAGMARLNGVSASAIATAMVEAQTTYYKNLDEEVSQ